MNIAPEYVAARRVLLDVLTALEDHLSSLVLVGAQAVYHHTGATSLNVPLVTTDADLALDTRFLMDAPEIGGVLRSVGFTPGPNPGHWRDPGDIAVDIMVVPHQTGTTKASARAARLSHHEKQTARIAPGLEPALIDNEWVLIDSFESADTRTHKIRVAGPAALLSAKAVKISERIEQASAQPDRLREKDALDAFRILQTIGTVDLVDGFARHAVDEHAQAVSATALEMYRAHASSAEGIIPQLAGRAASGDPSIAPSFAVLVQQLLTELKSSGTF
jgi:hypothetical protein